MNNRVAQNVLLIRRGDDQRPPLFVIGWNVIQPSKDVDQTLESVEPDADVNEIKPVGLPEFTEMPGRRFKKLKMQQIE